MSPRFSLELKKQITQPGVDLSNLDDFLKRAASFTPEQVEKEFTKLCSRRIRLEGTDYTLASILAYKWGKTAPRQALEWLTGTNTGPSMNACDRDMLRSEVIRGWAETNPERAAAYFFENRHELPSAKKALSNIAEEMSRSSPEHAIKWMAGLSEEDRNVVRIGVLTGLADAHPEVLAKQIAQLLPPDKINPDNIPQRLALSQLAARWASLDLDAALQWSNTLPENMQEETHTNILRSLSNLEPEKALEKYNKLDAQTQKLALPAITRSLSQKNPVEAMKWLTENAPEETIAKNIQYALDPLNSPNAEVKEYISQMNDGPVKDAALSQIAQSTALGAILSFSSFEEALSLTKDIKNLKEREYSIGIIFQHWQNEDIQEAKTWLETSSLPDDLKTRQLKELKEWGERYE